MIHTSRAEAMPPPCLLSINGHLSKERCHCEEPRRGDVAMTVDFRNDIRCSVQLDNLRFIHLFRIVENA